MTKLDSNEIATRYAVVYRGLHHEAQQRHGYVSDARAARAGLDPALCEAAIEIGLILRSAPGLLNLHRSPPNDSLADRAIRAWIETGERAVVSHASALAFLGLGEPPTILHLTCPLEAAEPLAAIQGLEIHHADVPEIERSWSASVPVPVTSAPRTLVDCAAAGLAEALLSHARAEAQRRALIAASDAPARPRIVDVALRLALLNELSPLRERTERLERMSREALAAWASAAPLPETFLPVDRLKWSADELLWPAVCAGDDGIIRDLSGIEGYPKLRVVDLRSSQLASLEPLVALEELTVLHLGLGPNASLEPLLRCARLQRVRLQGYEAALHGSSRVALESRGVVVDLVAGHERRSAAPWADPMVKLAVLESLAGQGEIDLPVLIPIDEDELDRENLDRLLAIELSPAQLAAVEELVWEGGGMEVQHLVWPQFDGESDEFVIRSLAGIDALPNLRTLRLVGMQVDPTADEIVALRARGVEVELE